jgi:hypothetical protein
MHYSPGSEKYIHTNWFYNGVDEFSCKGLFHNLESSVTALKLSITQHKNSSKGRMQNACNIYPSLTFYRDQAKTKGKNT